MLLCLASVMTCLAGCETVGDIPQENLNEIQLASFRVAVGAVMTAAPETVRPANEIATTLLALLSSDDGVMRTFEELVRVRVIELGMKLPEAQSVVEIFHLIRASLNNLNETEQLKAFRALLVIVQECANARDDVTSE